MTSRLPVIFGILLLCLGNPLAAQDQEPAYFVGVHYYPWHHENFHGREYLRRHLVPPQSPALGEYDDRTPRIIRAHIEWCRNAGVNFWSASWWGPGTDTDVTLRSAILPHPDLGSLKIAVHYETVGRTDDFSDYSNLGPDIGYLAEHYFPHPAYLRIDGKPVVIVYLTRVLSGRGTLASSLTTMRDAARAAGFELYIMGDQVFGEPPGDAGDIALLDGIMNYDVYGAMGADGFAGQDAVNAYYAAQAGWKALADSTGTDYAPAVTPGFNDRAVRDGNDAVARKLTRDDDFGSLFRAMLQGAKPLTDSDIDHMIFVTSWNEWHEDTQIEPVDTAPPTTRDNSSTGTRYTQGYPYEGYGTRYLDILREETGPAFTINAGLSDAWFNPATNGQGFFINVFPEIRQIFLGWFTYETERPPEDLASMLGEPGHRWVTAQGGYSGSSAVLEVWITEGGVFDSAEPPVERRPVGEILLEFSSCNSGTVAYDIPSIDRQGLVPIERLTLDNVALCHRLIAETEGQSGDG
jgi:hypothetical protein